MEKVELLPAFVWDCPDCGTANFERAVRMECSREEYAALKADAGFEVADEGEFLTQPDTVACRKCLAEFDAEYEG